MKIQTVYAGQTSYDCDNLNKHIFNTQWKDSLMPLQFPSFDHVPLRNPPLSEVVCQVRFPLILQLQVNVPSEFQDRIFSRFPILEIEHPIQLDRGIQASTSTGKMPSVYRFFDEHRASSVSISANFFAITTTQYSGWTSFASDFRLAAQSVFDIYKLSVLNRIGLRYVNTLTTENTQSEEFASVMEFIRPELTTTYRLTEITEYVGLTRLMTDHQGGKFSLISGVIQEEEDPQPSFVLDFDHFQEGERVLSVEALIEICDKFHSTIYNAFRWAIVPERLHIFE
ncbi:MAG: TIGR04255 family protein [Anaerolineae bacterium]|nr:TIGR04255 family protein [Anaerolineae bacterium]